MSFKDTLQYALKKKQEVYAQKKEVPGDDVDAGEKILFTGLDNSGKTSIILALQNKYSKIAILQPTRQTERSAFTYLGNRITRWDLGGQQRYRIAYLKSPGKYFDKTSVCVFVIDVQDKERIDEGVGYLKEVITMFKQLNIAPPIYIFLHKADPDWIQVVEDLQGTHLSSIGKKIRDAIGGTSKLFFKVTSIFDPWTIISAFSEVLLQLHPKSELVDHIIQEFAKKVDAEGMVVLDNNALILGQFYKNAGEKMNFEAITPYVLQIFENFRTILKKNQKMAITLDEGEYMFHAVKDPLHTEERFVFIKTPLSRLNEDDIQEFGSLLSDLLSKK